MTKKLTLPKNIPKRYKLRDFLSGKNSHHWWVVIATWLLVAITLFVGWCQIVTFKKATEDENRPYLTIAKAQTQNFAPISPNNNVCINLEIKNVGKTPAHNATLYYGFKTARKISMVDIEKLGTVGFNNISVFQDIPFNRPFCDSVILAEENFRLIYNWEKSYYFFGKIEYNDEYGESRRLTFNLKYHPREQGMFFQDAIYEE